MGDLTQGFAVKPGGFLQNLKTQMKLPPPGAYEVQPKWKSDDQTNKFDSMMRSDTVRELQGGNRGPGPAYYKTRDIPVKLNFNNNPDKNFLL